MTFLASRGLLELRADVFPLDPVRSGSPSRSLSRMLHSFYHFIGPYSLLISHEVRSALVIRRLAGGAAGPHAPSLSLLKTNPFLLFGSFRCDDSDAEEQL